jgi:hypothetical protein
LLFLLLLLELGSQLGLGAQIRLVARGRSAL